MRLLHLAWLGPLALLVITLMPVSAATLPVSGVVTTCASSSSCQFVFNTSKGTGWANATPPMMSFQLPGEAKASYNLSYSTYIKLLTGTYTYWTVGTFLGTDVNTGHVVYGTTNTNFTITCVGHSGKGGGCTYVYTTDNGTIVFRFTNAQQTSTAVTCNPSTVNVSAKTTCKVTVSNLWNASNVPTGKVHLQSPGLGSFASRGVCTLTAGSCSLTWQPFDNTVGSVSILATYGGSSAFYKSSGSTTVVVNGGG